MFVWYAGKDDVRFRFFVHTNIKTETRINEQLKADIFFADGRRCKKNIDVLTDSLSKKAYFKYANETIFFDDFLAPTAEEFIEHFHQDKLDASEVYAVLEKESARLLFRIEGKMYQVVEEPHLKCDLAHMVYFTDGVTKNKIFTDELVLALTYKDIVPKLA